MTNPSTPISDELAEQATSAPTRSERISALRSMSASERLAAYRAGAFDFDTCCIWAAVKPREVPLLNGEFEFIARTTPEVCE